MTHTTETPLGTQFGGYAESIIKDPSDYNWLEIHGVREHEAEHNEPICEVDDENPQFYSVYAHYDPEKHGRGCECVGDFAALVEAKAYAQDIADRHGWTVKDESHWTPVQETKAPTLDCNWPPADALRLALRAFNLKPRFNVALAQGGKTDSYQIAAVIEDTLRAMNEPLS